MNATILITARRGSALDKVARVAIQRGATGVHTLAVDYSQNTAAAAVINTARKKLGGMC